MTSLGISLLGAVGGIAHHPLQSMMTTGASPRSLAAGVGLGIVGMFTKPLSGAAELLALTGQGKIVLYSISDLVEVNFFFNFRFVARSWMEPTSRPPGSTSNHPHRTHLELHP